MPVISNQKVNVDSHVLSQDVDMHPPPIIFRNQDTNDIPITSGTYTADNNQELSHQQQQHEQHEHHYNHAPPSTGNLIRENNRSPFVVDIQSINFGMSNEDSVSGEVGDESAAAQLVHTPSIHDHAIIDQHKDDDYENEQGEVIQESNAVPQLASSDQSISDNNLNQIPDFAKLTTKQVHKDSKAPFTQTEANSLWERYPSTSELYSVSFSTTERLTTIDSIPAVQHENGYHHGTSTANRHPFGVPNQVHVQIPSIAPSLVNDMYIALTTAQNRSQTPKPLQPTRPNFVTRSPSNKQIFYGHHHQPHQYHNAPQPIESRPKFANIGTPHHHTLQNLPVPPHFVGPLFAADSGTSGGGHRPSHAHPHPRRPISVNQKPFGRYPVYYNKPISTNYSAQHTNVEPIKPNWHSSKPFDTHFGLNVPQQQHLMTSTTVTTMPTTTTPIRQTQSTQHDQSLQTSEIHHNNISTQRPFTYKTNSNKPDTEMAMITHYTDPSTNITQAAASSGNHNTSSDLFDLTRGKPFVFHGPSNLNIGEETRPANVNRTMDSKLNGDLLQADIFDYHENKVTAITEANIVMETTDNGLPGITNAAFVPFGDKIKVTNPHISSTIDREVYPKTPATEMQPPPTHATKFKPYIQKHVPAISSVQASTSPHHYENILTEEVLGLQPPPPIPKLSVKQKIPSELQGYGKVAIAHNLRPLHKPNGFYSITAPTHYPEPPPTFITTHHQHHGNAGNYALDVSTELADVVQYSQHNRPDSDANESDGKYSSNNRNVIRVNVPPPRETSKATSKPTTTTNEPTSRKTTSKSTTTTTTSGTSSISNFDDYVRYNIESIPDVITKKPPSSSFKYSTPRMPSNGHMPQSPQFDENSLIQPSQYHIFSEIEDTVKFVQPTAALPAAETVKATRHTVHDAQIFTVTTTKHLLTLTRTETSTIVDTVTHTLVNVKPTRVTVEPTIKPTIFTAPVTMQKVSGTKASIVPNPSFSIYAIGSAHDESEHEHDRSNDSSEDQSFEFDNIHDMDHVISPTPKISEPSPTKHAAMGGSSTNDSIFVVMTDRKKLGTININADLLHTLTSSLQNNKTNSAAVINGHGNGEHDHGHVISGAGKSQATLTAIDDVSSEDDDLFDLPKRDEDDQSNDVSHVLLGGILIATPPKSEISKNNNGGSGKSSATGRQPNTKNTHRSSTTAYVDNNPADEIDEHIESQGAAIIEETRAVHEKSKIAPLQCQPECKAVNNEVCQVTGDLTRCVCRPGFARMFLDRPCKRK